MLMQTMLMQTMLLQAMEVMLIQTMLLQAMEVRLLQALHAVVWYCTANVAARSFGTWVLWPFPFLVFLDDFLGYDLQHGTLYVVSN